MCIYYLLFVQLLKRQFPDISIVTGIIDKTDVVNQGNYLAAGMGYQPERYYGY